MKTLSIDIETCSGSDLGKAGVYRYAEDPDFRILLFGYSVDEGQVQVADLAHGEALPEEVRRALTDPAVIKYAYNANFERVCLSRFLGMPAGTYLNPDSWRCTMVWSAGLGLPLGLSLCGEALGLEKKKLEEGKALVRYYSKGTESVGTVHMTHQRRVSANRPPDSVPAPAPPSLEDQIRWIHFMEYNRRDVEAELEIRRRLSRYPLPDFVWDQYHLDQRINDRGVAVDMELVDRALELNELSAERLTARMKDLTGLENPNSVLQLRRWLSGRGVETDSLSKQTVEDLLAEVPEELAEVLCTRQQLSRTSVKKYEAIRNSVCADGRVRGMFRFYGAVRTGRWSGRGVQLQNLPQNHITELTAARDLLKVGDYEGLQANFGPVPDTLSQLIRTAFVPAEGHRFLVADFAAIEARVIAYLAGEQWRNAAFAEGKDIYCASAAQMFHVPVEKNGINGELRQKGKIAELALGYGGGVAAMVRMGALHMGLDEDELPEIVTAWREASPNICGLWHELDAAFRRTEKWKLGETVRIGNRNTPPLQLRYSGGCLFLRLPSGRRLVYPGPKQTVDGNQCFLSFLGTEKHSWTRVETYGARITENVVQAIARDILAEAMLRLSALGCRIVMHVHDEVVIEAPEDLSLETVCLEMARTPEWLPGIRLRADGYECSYYKKQ